MAPLVPEGLRDSVCAVGFQVLCFQRSGMKWATATALAAAAGVKRDYIPRYLRILAAVDHRMYHFATDAKGNALADELSETKWVPAIREISWRNDCAETNVFAVVRELRASETRPEPRPSFAELAQRTHTASGLIPQLSRDSALPEALRKLKLAAAGRKPAWLDGDLERLRGRLGNLACAVAALLCAGEFLNQAVTDVELYNATTIAGGTLENHKRSANGIVRRLHDALTGAG
jgi:hypothetical protein